MIEWLFAFFIFFYCLFIIYLWIGWERVAIFANREYAPSVAVIIPVRNEAKNIENLLNNILNQSYRGELQLILVDDHSEDDTVALARKVFNKQANCKLLELIDKEGKKAAITEGVTNAEAEIILTTDGDCSVSSKWVEAMVESFDESTQFVSGPINFIKESTIFNYMQSIEFTSLIASGAAFIGWGKPVMANGANLAFRKAAFMDVNGFEGNETTASGDDVFLLHKIVALHPNSIAFAMHQEAIVQTKAQPTISLFIKQRIRWASKWKAYTDIFTKSTAVLVFLVSLLLVIWPFLVITHLVTVFTWINLLIIKSFFDYFFLKHVSNQLRVKINVLAFVLLQVIYPLYVVFTALFSFKNSYQWKGRQVK